MEKKKAIICTAALGILVSAAIVFSMIVKIGSISLFEFIAPWFVGHYVGEHLNSFYRRLLKQEGKNE